MTAPVSVYDLDFLAKSKLCFETDPRKRTAYFAGMFTAFRVSMMFSEIEAHVSDMEFWTALSGVSRPWPDSGDFVKLLGQATWPRLTFTKEQIVEPELRMASDSGDMYYCGLTDGVTVAICQVPVMFRYLDENSWKRLTLDWIAAKIRWVSVRLEQEKTKVRK